MARIRKTTKAKLPARMPDGRFSGKQPRKVASLPSVETYLRMLASTPGETSSNREPSMEIYKRVLSRNVADSSTQIICNTVDRLNVPHCKTKLSFCNHTAREIKVHLCEAQSTSDSEEVLWCLGGAVECIWLKMFSVFALYDIFYRREVRDATVWSAATERKGGQDTSHCTHVAHAVKNLLYVLLVVFRLTTQKDNTGNKILTITSVVVFITAKVIFITVLVISLHMSSTSQYRSPSSPKLVIFCSTCQCQHTQH